MHLHIQQEQAAIPHDHGISAPALAAFFAAHAAGSDPSAWLIGRTLTLPFLDSIDDAPLDLDATVGPHPVLIHFFPGGWSRSCNAALGALQDRLPALKRLGIAVVAATPELPQHARETVRRNALTYTAAVDHGCRFAKSLGIARKLPVELRRLLREDGIRLRSRNGEGSYDVPVPTLVLVAGDRRILAASWAAVATDLDPGRLLRALDGHPAAESAPAGAASGARILPRSAVARRGGP